jgi:predicted HicB family RNase H-like nuclease
MVGRKQAPAAPRDRNSLSASQVGRRRSQGRLPKDLFLPDGRRVVEEGLVAEVVERGVRFDEDAEIFHGEVIGLRDVVTFQGKTVLEIQRAFCESLDDYLVFCKSRGEQPDKPFSGRFLLRLNPAIHRRLAELSAAEGESLNNWIASRLEDLPETRESGRRIQRTPLRSVADASRRVSM